MDPQPGTSTQTAGTFTEQRSEDAVCAEEPCQSDAIYRHTEKLKLFCRTCGQFRVQKNARPVAEFRDTLMRLIQLDINNDNKHIHPHSCAIHVDCD